MPFLHTSFFILVNAVPSTHFRFPLYETLALHTSPFFISYRAGTPHLFFFSLIYASFPYLFILTPIYAVRLYIDFLLSDYKLPSIPLPFQYKNIVPLYLSIFQYKDTVPLHFSISSMLILPPPNNLPKITRCLHIFFHK